MVKENMNTNNYTSKRNQQSNIIVLNYGIENEVSNENMFL